MERSDQVLLEQTNLLRFSHWLVAGHHLQSDIVEQVRKSIPPQHQLIGQLARKYGCLTNAEVRLIVDQQQVTEERFGETAIRRGLISHEVLANLLAWQQENPETFTQYLVSNRVAEAHECQQLLNDYLDDVPIRQALATVSV